MSAKLYLYGQFRWELSSGELVRPLRDKTQALLAYIALSGTGVVSRRQVATLLWEHGRDPNASLRQSVREIKDVEAGDNTPVFTADAKYLMLDLSKLWVDVRLASECAQAFKAGLATQLIEGEPGGFLQNVSVNEDAFDDWLMTERSRREEDLVYALEQLLQYVTEREAEFDRVKRITAAILNVDPTNESAHRGLMKAYYADGDKASALRQYQVCEEAISREFDVEPSEETQTLASMIKSNSRVSGTRVEAQQPVVRIVDDTSVKPVIQVEQFVISPQNEILDFFSKSFKADICEQLSRNRRFSVREATTPILNNIGDSNNSLALLSLSDYSVRGNMVSVTDRMTLLLQLQDGLTGDILWMKRISPDIAGNSSGTDDAPILAAIEMLRFIELQEMDKANNTADVMLSARQCVSRAVSIMFKFSEEAVTRAERYLLRALLLEPNYAEALAWLAFLRSIEIGQGYAADPEAVKEEIGVLVRQSIELCPHDDVALAIAGHLESFIHHDFESAIELFERALSANPNCAFAWGFNAITHCYIGKPEEALMMLHRCRQVMPFDPHPYYFDTARCIASMLSGKYEDAVRIGRQVLRNNPNFHANYRPLISSLGHLGRQDEAEPLLLEFEKYQPDFSVAWHLENYPPLDQEKTEAYITGLRKAGVSE